MKRVKRTAVIVIPKEPFINWASSVDDGHVKFGDNSSPEHTISLVEDITDYVVDAVEIIKPHFRFIFMKDLNSWHRLESDWPPNRDLDAFLEWFLFFTCIWDWVSRNCDSQWKVCRGSDRFASVVEL